MIQVTEEQVRDILPMDECVRIMRQTFAALRKGTASNQPRRRIYLDNGSTLHSMGGVYGKYFGTKFYSIESQVRRELFLFSVRQRNRPAAGSVRGQLSGTDPDGRGFGLRHRPSGRVRTPRRWP